MKRSVILFLIPVVVLFSIAISILNFFFPANGVDWVNAFYPAVIDVFSGHYPYIGGAFNPPWTFLVLAPVALFPPALGAIIMEVLNFLTFGLIAWKLGAKPLAMAAIVFSPQVICGAVNGNIDWLVCLGFFMPPWLGLFFVLMKPQIGIAVAVFWLVQSWREGGLIKAIRTFAPVTIATGLSFLAYGPWPLVAKDMASVYWNTSLWPQSIPIGLALLVLAIQRNNLKHAVMASPFLAPYVVIHSWIVPVLGLLPNQWVTVAAVIGLWLKELIPMF